jgi:hypothetical protein
MDMSRYYKIVPEEVMIEADAASRKMGEANNSFGRLLKVAEEYKEAGTTPFFVLDVELMNLYVVCEETFKKKLH